MNIFQQFLKSLYSPKTIARFRFQGIGKTILYIFVMMFLVSIPLAITNTNSFMKLAKLGIEKLETAPEFQFKDDSLLMESKEPFIEAEDDFLLVIDSTNSISIEEANNYSTAIFLFEKELITYEYGKVNQYSYSQFGNLSLKKEDFIKLMKTLHSLLPLFIPIFLVILYLTTTALKFIGITVLATIGLVLLNIVKVRLNYKQLWVLAAYAVTLPTALLNVLEAFIPILPYTFILYWGIAIYIMYVVLSNIPKPKVQQTNDMNE